MTREQVKLIREAVHDVSFGTIMVIIDVFIYMKKINSVKFLSFV